MWSMHNYMHYEHINPYHRTKLCDSSSRREYKDILIFNVNYISDQSFLLC